MLLVLHIDLISELGMISIVKIAMIFEIPVICHVNAVYALSQIYVAT